MGRPAAARRWLGDDGEHNRAGGVASAAAPPAQLLLVGSGSSLLKAELMASSRARKPALGDIASGTAWVAASPRRGRRGPGAEAGDESRRRAGGTLAAAVLVPEKDVLVSASRASFRFQPQFSAAMASCCC